MPTSALLEAANMPTPTLDDIFLLSAEQQAEFLDYFNAPKYQEIAPHERIYQFLARHLQGFDYQGENYTASQAYALKGGNCISLAVLTKALADLVGVEIEFQSIVSAPVYSIENDFMLSSDHVRTFLFNPNFTPRKGEIYFGKPYIIVDYMPAAGDMTGPRVSQQTFIAMFYRNLAADALLAKQYEQVLALLKVALQYDPSYGAIINLTAIVHRRMNEADLAEQFYRYGLDISEHKATLISNYAMLKQGNGDTEAAHILLQSLVSLAEHDPYLWYLFGITAQQQHKYQDAIIFLKKATEQAPYMHQLQLELALAYYRNNQPEFARQILIKASELAPVSTQQRYYAKLEAI